MKDMTSVSLPSSFYLFFYPLFTQFVTDVDHFIGILLSIVWINTIAPKVEY